MKSLTNYLLVALLLALGVGIYGCSKAGHEMPRTDHSATGGSTTKRTDMPGIDHSPQATAATTEPQGEVVLMAGMEGVSQLSKTDQVSAVKQHICPVSGEMIGSMGKPIKVSVKDQDVWLCCDSCKKKLLENPDEYLAKLHTAHNQTN